jgi:S1-C subfamily serine protease
MSTHDDESLASSNTSLGLQLPPEFSTPSASKLRVRNRTSWVATQNATFQVFDSPFEHASVSMERTAGRLRNADQIYFCSAPMGPLGLIVDSSPNGPFVHSLKPNSPLTGLLKPGDYIIAVDDVDTHQMNAATLTQLMAKLATNPVRKITFYKGPSRAGTSSI